jgi:deazaflavin-dependent oxidoreductase (nitroreductase family)
MERTTRLWPLHRVVTTVVNPVTRTFAGWVPGFGILTYPGRKTGTVYHTPINVFRKNDGYVFALTYGSGAEWVQNVLAAGSCGLRTRGHDIRLVEPELIVDPTRRLMPAPLRFIGRIDRVGEFLTMRIGALPAPGSSASVAEPSPPPRSP